MKKDVKGVLKIKTIIGSMILMILLATSIQITNIINESKKKSILELKSKIAKTEVNLNEEKLNELSEVFTRRDFEITTRSNAKRLENIKSLLDENNEIKEEEKKEEYISIDEIKISKDMDLSKRCGISKEDFKTLMANLKPDTTKFFYNNADIIYDLCEKYEINEIFFCGLIAGESGWRIAQNHRNTCNYISMMSKGKLIRYSTPEEGLEAAAKLLHNCYLTEGGSYYNGKTIYGVQKCYCPESTWVGLIYGCMRQIV